ncbi:MAG: Fur family transcriptional regulator [Myxococcota bacterium]
MTPLEAFRAWLAARDLRPTPQRMLLAEVLLQADDHPSAEELVARAREQMPNIGASTAWRTLALLVQAGLVDRQRLGGVLRYEEHGEHHDHIVCVDCGRLCEVRDPALEARQHLVAQRLGFRVVDHVHEIQGRCLNLACPYRPAP